MTEKISQMTEQTTWADTDQMELATAGGVTRRIQKINMRKNLVASPAQGDVLYYNGTDWVRLAAGTAGQLLQTNGASANPSWVSRGLVVQTAHTQSGSVATGTTTIPFDDTIPQSTEGDLYLTASIIPANINNKLLIEVVFIASHSALGQFWVALFQDSGADALAVSSERIDSASNIYTITLRHEMIAGTTSNTTFKVRAGSSAAGTTTFNGSAGARYMGGVFASSIRITEIKV